MAKYPQSEIRNPKFQLALYPGDGIGPEVIDQAVRVLDRVQQLVGFAIEWQRLDWGYGHWQRHGRVVPEDFLDEMNYVGSAQPRAPAQELQIKVETPAGLVLAPTTAKGTSSLEDVALEAMAQALRTTGGNVSVAAKLLGVSRNTIYRKKAQLPDDVWG